MEETLAHIPCECKALASLTHAYLGSFFLEPKDIQSISLGAIWSFSKASGLPWLDTGHKGPALKPSCIGAVRSRTLDIYSIQALRLCTGRTAHRGSSSVALLFHDHGTRRGWEISVMSRPLFTPGKDPVPIVQEAGLAPGPVWTGAENLAPHRDSIPGPSIPLIPWSFLGVNWPLTPD